MSRFTNKIMIGVGMLSGLLAILTFTPTASAVTGADWNAGNIINDGLFFNSAEMSTGDIQNFLNSKVPVCDTNGTQPYGGTTRAAYGASQGYPAPYTCLKDYIENPTTHQNNANGGSVTGGWSAAQIIKSAADTYNINPKALIVLLQKEQSLVTDDWPWTSQYRSATGYGCPDTAPCDAEYYGFYNQVTKAAYQFRRYATYPTEYRYKAFQSNYIQYNPNVGCGGSDVGIANQATAGLYNYTPYQPNASALANLYGSGDSCGAYGNRNFWRMYNDWFGSTQMSIPYNWSIESYTYAGGDNLIAQGQTETVTLRARNIGSSPWYNHGEHPVRLGTWSPPDRASPLASSGWLANNRPSNMQENSVQPGEIGTFTFQITPSVQGTFVEALNLVVENSQWMRWPGFSPTIVVTDGYQWQIDDVIYEKATGLMEPGSSQLITVKARNTGNITWDKLGPNPVRIGTWEPQRQSAVVTSDWRSSVRVVDMNENTVAPGQVAGFQFHVRTPSVGNFYERFNLVAEGRSWLNDQGLTLYLRGGAYAWQPVWYSHSTGNINIPRNTNFTLTIKARNTGDFTWRKASGFPPVRLGTTAPLDRGSAFYTPSWIRDTRPAVVVEDIVAPGQEGTFTFTAKTPSSPGMWNERFVPVAEGMMWFNDTGFSVPVNVL